MRVGRGWNRAEADGWGGGGEGKEYFGKLQSTDTDVGAGWDRLASYNYSHGVAPPAFPAKSCPFPVTRAFLLCDPCDSHHLTFASAVSST